MDEVEGRVCFRLHLSFQFPKLCTIKIQRHTKATGTLKQICISNELNVTALSAVKPKPSVGEERKKREKQNAPNDTEAAVAAGDGSL